MKYYFDTSSLVKIYHPEQGSKETLELYEGNWEICISELGALEFVSAVRCQGSGERVRAK